MFNYYNIDRETGKKIDFSPKSDSWKTASTPINKVSFKMPNESQSFKFEDQGKAWCIIDKDMKVLYMDIDAARNLKHKFWYDSIAIYAYEKGYAQAVQDIVTHLKYMQQ